MEKLSRQQMSLFVLSLAIGAVMFMVPSPAGADGCNTGKDCTYYDSNVTPSKGRCGSVGAGCGCVAGGVSQPQTACNS